MRKLIIITGITLIGLASCKKDNAEEMYPADPGVTCDTTNVTFSGTIQPIIEAKCVNSGCHHTGTPSGIVLTAYSGIAAIANNGKLISAITHDGNASFMPEGQPKLDDCTIAKITKWVNDGAPNN